MKQVPGIYVGRRVTTAHKLGYFWVIDGREAGYAKQLAPAKIGECWTLSLKDNGDVIMGAANAPKMLPDAHSAPFERTREWAALDVAAQQSLATRRMNKRLAARKTEFDTALEPLRHMADALHNHDERACFIQAVTAALWRR